MRGFIVIAFLTVCLAEQSTDMSQVIHIPFRFGYKRRDYLSVRIHFKNPTLNIKRVYISTKHGHNFTDLRVPELFFWVERHLPLMYSELSITAELYNESGFCDNILIVDGKVMPVKNSTESAYAYNDICLKQKSCVIEVDLHNECTDKEPVTLSTTKEPATKPIDVEQNSTDTAVPDGIPVPGGTVETTTTATARGTANADTNYTTTIIVTTLAVIVLVIVAAFVARKHCHCKCNRPETQELPTRDLSDRFYVNLLFRRECQQEIEELEEHHYEEINYRAIAAPAGETRTGEPAAVVLGQFERQHS